LNVGVVLAALVLPCWPEIRCAAAPGGRPAPVRAAAVAEFLVAAPGNGAGDGPPGDRAGLRSNPQMQPTSAQRIKCR
jgi:hypothetical protein